MNFHAQRWGRCQESRGEDPHLTSRFTVAFVKALQDSNGSKYLPVTAMLKDFPVYNLESSQPAGGTDWQVEHPQDMCDSSASTSDGHSPVLGFRCERATTLWSTLPTSNSHFSPLFEQGRSKQESRPS